MPADTYNAFFSYAWVDNQPFEEGGTGWVSTFVDRLRKHLGRELRRQTEGDRVWIDYERLRGNQPLSGAIRGALSDSRLLLPIVSPAYFASVWCRQELETFFALHGKDTDRIFPTWMEPVAPDEIPADARSLAAGIEERLEYSFCYQDTPGQWVWEQPGEPISSAVAPDGGFVAVGFRDGSLRANALPSDDPVGWAEERSPSIPANRKDAAAEDGPRSAMPTDNTSSARRSTHQEPCS